MAPNKIMNASALCAVVVLCCANVCCYADNFTNSYRNQKGHNYQSRQNRLLTFNTGENDDIQIELDFSVPFISIPVKSDMGNGAMANLNIGAVALAGMMAFGAAFVIPATYHLFAGKKGFVNGEGSQNSQQYQGGNKYRSK